MNFTYHSRSARVTFGRGESESLPQHLAPFNRILVIAGPRFRDRVEQLQNEMGVKRIVPFSKVLSHVPQDLVDEAAGVVRQERPDAILAMGGGSAIGLAKALALGLSPELQACYFEEGLDAPAIIAVPTTFSGSEQTDIWGITAGDGKITGRSPRVLPDLVIYDPELLVSLPVEHAVTSAMNAMAHLVEAVYATDGNPVTRFQALQGIQAIVNGLRQLGASASGDAGSRAIGAMSPDIAEILLFGAFLGGKCLREVSMSLEHKAAHVLGGSFGCDHAAVHSVLLPHVLEYQWPHLDADIRTDLENAIGANPARILQDLAMHGGAPANLREIGMEQTDLPRVVDLILEKPYPSPAPPDRRCLLEMFENAWIGALQEES